MTPTAAVRSILGDPSGTLSEARCREVVVAVLRACREPSARMIEEGASAIFASCGEFTDGFDTRQDAPEVYRAMIDALIEEVTAEAGR